MKLEEQIVIILQIKSGKRSGMEEVLIWGGAGIGMVRSKVSIKSRKGLDKVSIRVLTMFL
jgi:hypothetical protein